MNVTRAMLAWVAVGLLQVAPSGAGPNELRLELPPGSAAERTLYQSEIDAALTDVLTRWHAAGFTVQAAEVVDTAIVFADGAQARKSLAAAFGVAGERIPPTFGGTVQDKTLYLVSRQSFRPIWTKLYPHWPWTAGTYRSLIAHELTHRVHEVVLESRYRKTSEAMGPDWFFEGLACVGADQFAGQPPMDLVEIERLVGSGRTPPVDYPLYARLVRALLVRLPLATLVEHAADRDFPDPLLGELDRVRLTVDASEADQVLAILALRRAGKPIDDAQWQGLFATEPYARLKQREAKIGEQFHEPTLAFTDQDFRRFVLSDDLLQRAPQLQATLERWRKVDLLPAAARVLAYLPAGATLRAKVYPAIKPNRNSFVWETSTDPAIFLYLDPDTSAAKFENTVAHELHHIGLASVGGAYEEALAGLSERPRRAATWLGSFGEGLAMLAAAGGPDADPHAASSDAERARWAHDLANFAPDLRAVEAFFLDVLSGKLASPDAIEEKGGSFFGSQGPWYTVGYRMAVLVEKRFGRQALISTMLDPRRLLVLYNRAAAERQAAGGEALPRWSEDLLRQVGATP